ncbi:MAG: hypothetical protein ACTSPF_02140, partial [Candidatus Heimdallarchaeaceae archaeon]
MISRKRGKRKGPEFLEPAREETRSAGKFSLRFLISLTIPGAILGIIYSRLGYYLFGFWFSYVLFSILGIEFLFLTFFSVKWFIKSRKLKSLLKSIYTKQNSKN